MSQHQAVVVFNILQITAKDED
ncbi:predicted protein [Aspergillus nidulans FGSC A4]|uniref:Uncharacterized protein n=1 Tax=Emericella nidulans (strain FGSC A4 / ATCC 38163 / CBS 112.46 / NRRL 194 / M139) TaxID=227321 RepID=Q5B2Y3_EMENI|nr:predicted protein [Aspergillus nidulans FGSC A4]CBF80853.1 TPA: hypothetical protein ANIA_05097 [Aspergillus nidulans FGSC A4]|eukprot:XP_662701.1 predicted protein [Aspergillus nidulans FGSC A4]